jgi:hypothetical protein
MPVNHAIRPAYPDHAKVEPQASITIRTNVRLLADLGTALRWVALGLRLEEYAGFGCPESGSRVLPSQCPNLPDHIGVWAILDPDRVTRSHPRPLMRIRAVGAQVPPAPPTGDEIPFPWRAHGR